MCHIYPDWIVYDLQKIDCVKELQIFKIYPDSKVYGANLGPTWVLSAQDGPHASPMNLAIRVSQETKHHTISEKL